VQDWVEAEMELKAEYMRNSGSPSPQKRERLSRSPHS
jgi:hypothetical protein